MYQYLLVTHMVAYHVKYLEHRKGFKLFVRERGHDDLDIGPKFHGQPAQLPRVMRGIEHVQGVQKDNQWPVCGRREQTDGELVY